ncbi:histidine ammonia-lyase [Peribacillus butanolivorans]|uniref:histidine ammonia-lyase n=1 Tax=Peribacillus butanolivorans TaxID=421767 RepID=UPI0039FDBA02
MKTQEKVMITEDDFSIGDLISVARHHAPLELSMSVKKRINQGRDIVERFVEEERVIYGITTGVGENSKIKISASDSRELQKNIIMSHACGMGDPLEKEIVRAIMVMMIKNLSLGYSGVRLETVERLAEMVNKDVIPFVPREGSLGYLNHQAHISLVLLGMGEAYNQGGLTDGETALKKAGIKPIELHEKEGLSLINGTVDMTAIGALAVYDAINVLKAADIVSIISFEALKGTYYAFDPKISKVKRHPGQKKTTDNIHKLIENSEITEKFKDYRTQDALSIRSIPQVHGACKDAVDYIRTIVEREMNSASDNPLVFDDQEGARAISSSNCHGEAIALAMDFLAISLSELANISERRIFRLVSPQHSELPPYLIEQSGLNSGYMISQYVAASLVSNNKVYSHPSSVDSIPTTGGQEDHVSMGTSAALKALKVIANTEKVIGIEWMCSCQGIEFHQPLQPGTGTTAACDLFRKYVPRLEQDRILYKDMRTAAELVHSAEIVKHVEAKIGPLQF